MLIIASSLQLAVIGYQLTSMIADKVLFYQANQAFGHYCKKCPAGSRVLRDCHRNMTNSECVACAPHHFNEDWTKLNYCLQCALGACPRYSVEVVRCTVLTNRKCMCVPGYHRFSVDNTDTYYECVQHSRCLSSQGQRYYGNDTHDTLCEDCSQGSQFVNTTQPDHPQCERCVVCHPGDLLQPCSLHSDTVCGGASNFTSPGAAISGGAVAGVVVSLATISLLIVVIVCRWNRCRFCSQSAFNVSDAEAEVKEDNAKVLPLNPLPDGGDSNGWHTDDGFCSYSHRDRSCDHLKDEKMMKLFHFVSQNVGEEWKLFIHSLPGWARNRSSTVIDHKSEEERTVPRRIFSCLVQWSFECPESVSVGGIKTALHAVNREDLQLDLDGAEDGRIGADGDGGV